MKNTLPKQPLIFLGWIAVAVFLTYGTLVLGKNAAIRRPHIILILADDMGRNDVSFNGANEIPTPNIDALAYNGVILNRLYAPPICTPSRTSLLTGRYPTRDGMQGFPTTSAEARGIPLNVTLMPEYFRKLGYSTRLIGKWHVGYFASDYTPARRGFDSFFGYYNGVITYYNHWISEPMNDTPRPYNGSDLHRDVPESLLAVNSSKYFTDLITDEAEKIIKNHDKNKPLFLEVAHLAVHASGAPDPLEVRNLTEVNEKFSYIKNEKRRKYAGLMKAMDDSVGRIMTALGKANMLENSIVLFMSDNGAPTKGLYANAGSNYPLRGIKNTLFEGGVRVAASIFSPLIKLHSRVSNHMIHISDWLPTLYFAAGGNLRVLKDDIDGVNQWPTIVKGVPSPRRSTLLNIDEVLKLEAAIVGRYKLVKKGANITYTGYYGESGNDPSYPAYDVEAVFSSPAGKAIANLQGFTTPNLRRAGEMRKNSSIQCKPVVKYANCSNLCLFDLKSDPCETRDLSAKFPMIVKTLESFIESYKSNLMPQTNLKNDQCADPQRFHGSWMPWRTNESLRILTTSPCESPNFKLLEFEDKKRPPYQNKLLTELLSKLLDKQLIKYLSTIVRSHNSNSKLSTTD